ncbi:hypothetical protein ACVWWP_000336, partial [Bradyrhizobium sp. LM3.6]
MILANSVHREVFNAVMQLRIRAGRWSCLNTRGRR